jgi:hypothetical protein
MASAKSSLRATADTLADVAEAAHSRLQTVGAEPVPMTTPLEAGSPSNQLELI